MPKGCTSGDSVAIFLRSCVSWGCLAQGRTFGGLYINQLVRTCTMVGQRLHMSLSDGLYIRLPEGTLQGFCELFRDNYVVTLAVCVVSVYLAASATISVDK